MIAHQRRHRSKMRSVAVGALAAMAHRRSGPTGQHVRKRFERWHDVSCHLQLLDRTLHNMHLCHRRGMRRLLAQAWRAWSGGWKEAAARRAQATERKTQRDARVESSLRALGLTVRRRESTVTANAFFGWRHSMELHALATTAKTAAFGSAVQRIVGGLAATRLQQLKLALLHWIEQLEQASSSGRLLRLVLVRWAARRRSTRRSALRAGMQKLQWPGHQALAARQQAQAWMRRSTGLLVIRIFRSWEDAYAAAFLTWAESVRRHLVVTKGTESVADSRAKIAAALTRVTTGALRSLREHLQRKALLRMRMVATLQPAALHR
jgi:hypothetical protein